jgi:hypothetical protein
MEDNDHEGQEGPAFDPQEAKELLGLSDLQFQFALAKMKGASNVGAAKEAGYRDASPDGSGMRAAGYRAFHSDKVQSFLAWAEREGVGQPSEPCDVAELRKILSKCARGSDRSTAIRASEVLFRLQQAEKEATASEVLACDPLETLKEIGQIDAVHAVWLAQKYSLAWRPEGWQAAPVCPTCRQKVFVPQQAVAGKANGDTAWPERPTEGVRPEGK